MIEIIPDKPEITDELAKSPPRLMKEYTSQIDNCIGCVYAEWCVKYLKVCPSDWEL